MPLPGLDEAQRKENAQRAALDAQAEVDELLWLMSDAKGRRFIWRRLNKAGIYRLSFAPGVEPLAAAFAEGGRNQGLELMNLLMTHCPERYIQMQKEARNHERRNRPGTSTS